MSQQTVSLRIYGRDNTGKGAARKVRKKDMVPGIVYGPKMETPFPVSFMPNDVIAAHKAAGKTSIVVLDTQEGAPEALKGAKVLIKEVQAHPYKVKLVHVDLHQIDLTKKMRAIVPVHFVGKSQGQADGGILNTSVREVEIRCAPDQIPSHLDIDITALGLNDGLSVSQLEEKYPNLEFIYENDFTLVSIVEVAEEKAAPVVAATDAAAAPAADAKAPAAKKEG
jgi:large subunit ribosomal protein L25